MGIVQLLFYFLSICTGVIVITLAAIIYKKYKKRVVGVFLILEAAFIIIQSGLMLGKLYLIEGSKSLWIEKSAAFLDWSGTVLLILVLPLFVTMLFGITVNKIARKGYIILIFAELSVVISYIMSYGNLYIKYIGRGIMIAVALYTLVITVFNYRNIGDRILRKGVLTFAIISILFIPIIIAGYYNFGSGITNAVIEMSALPLYMVVINVLSIILCIKYFGKPPVLNVDNNSLTKEFLSEYNITPREEEIISKIIQGKSYKTISEEMVIAYKTVDNHIQNIYQKTGVRRREQLVNLIKNNN